MQRVPVLGRGAAGKSTAARRLAEIIGLPLIELDTLFWSADLRPAPTDQWRATQRRLAADNQWIMDGDLGSYDQLDVRLAAADTIIVLDFPLVLCARRAIRRSRERTDFWLWVFRWRHRSRPAILQAVSLHAPSAHLIVLRSQSELEGLFASLAR